MEDNLDEKEKTDEKLLLLSMIFPKMCPDWLKSILDEIFRSCSVVEKKEKKKRIEKMFWMNVDELFSLSSEELGNLPSIQDWKEKKKLQEEIEMITNLSVEDLILTYGNPNTLAGHDGWTIPEDEFPLYHHHCIEFLKQKYPKHSLPRIQAAFKRSVYHHPALQIADYELQRTPNTRNTKRTIIVGDRFVQEQSLAFLKERRCLELQHEVARYQEDRQRERNERAQEVAMAEMLLRCTCCFSNTMLLPRELVYCLSGHGFCRSCIARSAHEVMGGGGGVVGCLAPGCHQVIGMDTLENILEKKVLCFLKQFSQTAEILASGLQNLVTCPFCPYMVVMEDPDDKILKCLNPDCSKNSCRRCQELDHCPLSCGEVAPLVKRRKVEEELTMSVVRQCWKCGVDFMRISACPDMACPRCGAHTCYACRKEWGNGMDHIECSNKEFMHSDSQQKAKHEKELAAAQERIKDEMEEVPDDIKDLLEAGPSSKTLFLFREQR